MAQPGNRTPIFPTQAATVTASDSTTFEPSVVLCQVSGDIKVQPAGGGTAVTYASWPANTPIPLMVVMVYTTGTTATTIIRHY